MTQRITVCYFSGTGNTLYLARTLVMDLIEKGVTAYIHNIEGSEDEHLILSEGDLVIMFPVYAYGPPKIVERFISKLPEGSERNISIVTDYGLLAGNAYSIAARMVAKRGYTIKYCGGVRMPANYINLYNTPKEDKVRKLIEQSEDKIKQISSDLAQGKKNRVKKAFMLLRPPLYMIYRIFLKKSNWMGSRFSADDKCTGCGICEKICPVSNINMSESSNRPVWSYYCEQCMRCIHFCPEVSIQWMGMTAGRRRYKHPKVELKDLIPTGL